MVEVTGLDRPGLLFELTATLSKLNLNIALGACRDLRRARGRRVLRHRPVRREDHLGHAAGDHQARADGAAGAVRRSGGEAGSSAVRPPDDATDYATDTISSVPAPGNRPLNRALYRCRGADPRDGRAWGRDGEKSSARDEPRFSTQPAIAPTCDLRESSRPNRRPRAQAEPGAANDDSPSPQRPRAKRSADAPPPAQARRTRRRTRPLAAVAVDLLDAGARPVGGDRRRRRHRVGRLHPAADPIARSAQATAEDRDRRARRQAPGDPRRNGRHRRVDQGAAALSAEGVHRHRGPPLLQPLRRRSDRARARGDRQRRSTAASRRADRRSPSSSPRTCS